MGTQKGSALTTASTTTTGTTTAAATQGGGRSTNRHSNNECLPCLQRLNLHGLYRVQDVFLLELARSRFITRVEWIELAKTSITDKGLSMLVNRLDSHNPTNTTMSYEYAYELHKEQQLANHHRPTFRSTVKASRATTTVAVDSVSPSSPPGSATTSPPPSPPHRITKCNVQDCKQLTPRGLTSFLSMSIMHVTHLDVRGCGNGTQKAAGTIAVLCAPTLRVLKVGFGLASIKAPPALKPWNMPTAQLGLNDRSLCRVLGACRVLEELVVRQNVIVVVVTISVFHLDMWTCVEDELQLGRDVTFSVFQLDMCCRRQNVQILHSPIHSHSSPSFCSLPLVNCRCTVAINCEGRSSPSYAFSPPLTRRCTDWMSVGVPLCTWEVCCGF